MHNKIFNKYSKIIIISFGFSALLTSNYYFDWYNNFSRSATFIQAFLDILILFVANFISIFLLLIFLNLIKKFKKLSFKYLYCILLSFFFVILLKTIFDIFGIISFKDTIFLFLSNILIFDIGYNAKKFIAFLSPYFLFFFIFLIFFKKKSQIIRFLLISGNIFLIIFLYREIDYNFFNKEENKTTVRFNYEIKDKIKSKNKFDKKVVWIILDAFDPEYVDKYHKNLMPNYQNLLASSFSHKKNYAPARYTIDSMPSILMGIPSGGFTIINNKYYLNVKDSIERHRFNFENTIFGRLNSIGIKSSVFSSVLEYCKSYLISNKFRNCQDTLTKKSHVFNNTHRTDNISFSEINKGIKIRYNFIDHYHRINRYLNKFTFFTELKKRFNHFFDLNEIKKTAHKDTSNINNLRSDENEFWIKEFKESKNVKYNSNDLDGRGSLFYDEIKDEINNNSNLIFIHSMLPHPRTKSSIHCAKYFNKPLSENVQDEYKMNLQCTDMIIENILKIMNDYQKKDDNLMLILTSDHHFRERPDSDKKEYPSLLLIKMFNDPNKVNSFKKSSSIYIQELIYKYFTNEIKNHNEINEFFKDKKFYTPFYSHY